MKYILALTFLSAFALANETSFPIRTIRVLTENVDRYYAEANNPFATLICKSGEAAQVMIVDSRYPQLDGHNFNFSSYEECQQSRMRARQAVSHCTPELVVNSATKGAKIRFDDCR